MEFTSTNHFSTDPDPIELSMKAKFVIIALILWFANMAEATEAIRVNQLGYTPNSVKAAVMLSDSGVVRSFEIHEALTDRCVYVSDGVEAFGPWSRFKGTFRLNFSSFRLAGGFYLQANGVRSPNFRIDNDVYDGTADFLLRYMRQQRSGFNPFLRDSCHTHDGYLVYANDRDSQFVNVAGGWHDAADYLQYVTTSATATYQMLFAYVSNPSIFGDRFRADGLPGSNGVPDILDEARWGLEWLVRMNPSDSVYYNQIADDRDHLGFRLPSEDTVNYGLGRERPVYVATGKPQGLQRYQNRSTGRASTTAKFSSAFSLGSTAFRLIDPEFASLLERRARAAYSAGLRSPGVCQTAPCRSPYFYEEENWVDDMELAAAELALVSHNPDRTAEALDFARREPFPPWMGSDSSRHYQWYPFVNLGHIRLAQGDPRSSATITAMMKEGIERVAFRARGNPFRMGIAFNWCSNNVVSSFLADLQAYRHVSGDSSYRELEAAMRDWLFGCNPWGTSMIIGLPRGGVSPRDPHSAFSHAYHYGVDGGLVDGPVRSSLFNSLKGVTLSHPDQFAEFQNEAVYHDDWADYSSNEPTMDGTASLTMGLSALEAEGKVSAERLRRGYDEGAITRMDSTRKTIYLVFTGHEFADGADTIAAVLKKVHIKASFFLTGDFYRTPRFAPAIRRLILDGHYLGAHSGKHLLYAAWEKRDSSLVTEQELLKDLQDNFTAMKGFGLTPSTSRVFLPPYEWHNQEVADRVRRAGLTLVNMTPGTLSNADYTIPSMREKYHSSTEIVNRILDYERSHASGLNGFILLMHIGTHPERTDKLYRLLPGLLEELRDRGYSFSRF
jgi:peptidoglycan/xylan/chitin deacetylase (PgdA/CDA1 family)